MKYEILKNEFKILDNGVKVFRIRALKDFGNVKKGDLGGFIGNNKNLSQNGNAWIRDNACVYGDARVYDDACVYDNACVYGDACVYDDARVCGDACVYGDARVYDDACVCSDACVYGDARVYSNARIKKSKCKKFYHFKATGREVWYGEDGIVEAGCFAGTLEEFKTRIYKDGNYQSFESLPKHRKEYLAIIDLLRKCEEF